MPDKTCSARFRTAPRLMTCLLTFVAISYLDLRAADPTEGRRQSSASLSRKRCCCGRTN